MKIVLIWVLQLQTIEMSWLEFILVNPSYNSLEFKKKKFLKVKIAPQILFKTKCINGGYPLIWCLTEAHASSMMYTPNDSYIEMYTPNASHNSDLPRVIFGTHRPKQPQVKYPKCF